MNDAHGAVGVVLNHPTELLVSDAVPMLSDLAGPEAVLFQGGPVQLDQAVLLVEMKSSVSADLPVFENVGFLTGEVDEALRPAVLRARVFVGYSGWGEGQLEAEIADDAWILEPAHVEDIFSEDPETLWRQVLQRKGRGFRHIAMAPKDPNVN